MDAGLMKRMETRKMTIQIKEYNNIDEANKDLNFIMDHKVRQIIPIVSGNAPLQYVIVVDNRD